MTEEYLAEIVDNIAESIELDVKVALREMSVDILFYNHDSGTSSANGVKFGVDEQTELIDSLMQSVADKLIRKLVIDEVSE